MIFVQLREQLQMLLDVLQQLKAEEFQKDITHLDGATIGQHTRHIIELLQCAEKAKNTGIVDYINRTRNLLLETNRQLAIEAIQQLLVGLTEKDFILKLQTLENNVDARITFVGTSYFREIVYNTEHITHHLALIKVALIELGVELNNPDFGYAYTTLQYRQQMAGKIVDN